MPDTFTYDMGALRTFLIADAAVNALVAGRVFAEELPDVEAVSMPRACVVISSVGQGSYFSTRSEVAIDHRNKDFKCYASSPYEASRVWGAVDVALKHLRRHIIAVPTIGSVLLYSAVKVGGPTTLREPESEWPLVFGTYSIMLSDTV